MCGARASEGAPERPAQSLIAWDALDLTLGVLTEIQDDALRTTLGASVGGVETISLNGGAVTARWFRS